MPSIICRMDRLKYIVFRARNGHGSCSAKLVVWGWQNQSCLELIRVMFCCWYSYCQCIINFKSIITLCWGWGLIHWKVLTQCFYSSYIFKPYLHICTSERLSVYSLVLSLLVKSCYYWELIHLVVGMGLLLVIQFCGGRHGALSFVPEQHQQYQLGSVSLFSQ